MKLQGGNWAAADDETGAGGVTDHGLLEGLTDDDHPQYIHETRGGQTSGVVTFGDSTMRVFDDFVQIGTFGYVPGYEGVLRLARRWNSSEYRKGIGVNLDQEGTGEVEGIEVDVRHYGADQNDGLTGIKVVVRDNVATPTNVYGIYSNGSDGLISTGVYGWADAATLDAIGVYGRGWTADRDAIGIFGWAEQGSRYNYAGYFQGDVEITGSHGFAAGGFKIDHPIDPSNRFWIRMARLQCNYHHTSRH